MRARCATKGAKIYFQKIIEGHLGQVELGDKVNVVVGLDDGIVVHYAYRRPVAALVCATREGDMMILDKSRSRDFLLKVGAVAAVVVVDAQRLRQTHIARSIQHLHSLIGCVESHVAVVGNVKLSSVAMFRLHLNYA